MPAPPIATGTFLQDRYRVVGLAGQGYFGQTYLARDQQRLNELCVLKEFLPSQSDPAVLQSLQRQFDHSAAILYGLKHPQLPSYQFMMLSEPRFYWVRDYIEGKSYGVLLDDRKSKGIAFSEQEVVQVLSQMLPVLHYLHSQTVIHRNISLDSIILRQKDQLPVLINFGLVTELVAQLQLHPVDNLSEIYGQWGYAPPEQLQSGQVFPCSDLYALGMTAIALLSGKEPEALYNAADQVIDWEPSITVNPTLRHILRRMLHPDPQRRFASAAEVAQAIHAMISAGTPLSTTPTRLAIAATTTAGMGFMHSEFEPDYGATPGLDRSPDHEVNAQTAPRPAVSPQGDDFAAGAAAMAALETPMDPPSTTTTTTSLSLTADPLAGDASGASELQAILTARSVELQGAPPRASGKMPGSVPQAILTKQAKVPAPGRKRPPSGRRIDIASLLLLLAFLLLSAIVSWRVFSFLTRQDTSALSTAGQATGSATDPPRAGNVGDNVGAAADGNSAAGTGATVAKADTHSASSSSGDATPNLEAMRVRRRNLGIDYRFLADFVDEVFYAKHPEWRGKKLDNSAGQETMRQEWNAIANSTMDKLQTLPANLRRKLGSYKQVNYEAWLLDLGEVGRSSQTLDALADQRVAELFPALKGQPLNPKTNGQVWYALAEEQLPQAKQRAAKPQ